MHITLTTMGVKYITGTMIVWKLRNYSLITFTSPLTPSLIIPEGVEPPTVSYSGGTI